MNPFYFLYAAFALWILQQANDLLHSFRTRKTIPKMYWISAVASFGSGLFLFKFINDSTHDLVDTILGLLGALGLV